MQPQLERIEVERRALRDHELAVEHAALRQLCQEDVDDLGEVSIQRLLVAALDEDLVPVAEHEDAEAVPLRLEDPLVAAGQLADALGEHRVHRRIDREVHRRTS
jgi:hypothetical protein